MISPDHPVARSFVSGCAGRTTALVHENLDVWARRQGSLGDSRVRPQDQHHLGGGRVGVDVPDAAAGARACPSSTSTSPVTGWSTASPYTTVSPRSRSRPRPTGACPASSSSTTHGRGTYRRSGNGRSAARHADVHARWHQAAGRERGTPNPLPMHPIPCGRIRRAASASSTSRLGRSSRPPVLTMCPGSAPTCAPTSGWILSPSKSQSKRTAPGVRDRSGSQRDRRAGPVTERVHRDHRARAKDFSLPENTSIPGQRLWSTSSPPTPKACTCRTASRPINFAARRIWSANEGDFREDNVDRSSAGNAPFSAALPWTACASRSGTRHRGTCMPPGPAPSRFATRRERLSTTAGASSIRGHERGVYDDGRSRDKGVEPEGVALIEIAGRTYAFVGLERTTTVRSRSSTSPTRTTQSSSTC